MSGEQLVAVGAGFLGLRWWWKCRRVSYHTKRRDWHDAKAWRLMRGGKP